MDFEVKKKVGGLGPPNPERCSWCDKPIVKGQDNVVLLYTAPEKIYGLDGQLRGIEGEQKLKAAFHATCFQEYKPDLPGRVECKYCGILSMATSLPDGRLVTDVCKCSCHRGKNYCSLLIK